jgi:hypothetical protein
VLRAEHDRNATPMPVAADLRPDVLRSALPILAEAYDAGDPRTNRMLVSVYQGLFALERFGRRPDGRIAADLCQAEDRDPDSAERE